jgi:methylated-DNA-[protein]-cysteine S-methyltransferase
MELLLDRVESPIGTMMIVSDGEVLRALDFLDYEDRMHRYLRLHCGEYSLRNARNPAGLSDRIRAYFDGELAAIDSIPVKTGGTTFQREVWTLLREIPAGATTTYGELAVKIGRPNSSRAVGMANGSNPIPIVLPCHRVIGANGALTGYGGGLDRKRWLLAHERALPSQHELIAK